MAKTLFEWDYLDYPGAKRYPQPVQTVFRSAPRQIHRPNGQRGNRSTFSQEEEK